jgi:dipeptidyl aminopeptidase/acylaminoacyl peptidase
MNSISSAIAAVFILTMTSNASATDVAELARLFGKRETITGVRMSPQGDYLLYRTPAGPRETSMRTFNLSTGVTTSLLSSRGSDLSIDTCRWAKTDRIVCRFSGQTTDGATKIGFTRLISLGRDGGESKLLGTRTNSRSLDYNQHSGGIIDILPDDPASVLMDVPVVPETTLNTLITKDKRGLSVQRVDVYSGRGQVVEQPNRMAVYHMTDSKGTVRLRVVQGDDGEGRLTSTRRYFVRMQGDKDWRQLAIGNVNAYDDFSPQGFDESGNWLYALKPHNDRQALFRISVDGSGREELVYAHQDVDVDGLVTFGRYDKPVGASYSTDYNHIEYFDPQIKSLSASLAKALPGKVVALIQDSWDGNRILLSAASDTDPGAYFIFDRVTKKLQMVSPIRPELSGRSMSETRPISFAASDGAMVPGYLTSPLGSTGKSLPLVVMPHGGPESRDYWGFNWLVQFLAANGYAVLQPNSRGSAGYGKAWLNENAIKNWRRAIDDVNDSARWAIAQGIADPRRIAILGWSYGGYAALQSNVVAPDLYKAAVAIAPVSDWQQMKADAQRYTNVKIVKDYIGSGPHVREGSPAENAAAIRAPVMLFHGTLDLNVNVKQSLAMKSALERAGKSVTYTEYEGLDHGLADSDARTDMLTKIGNFLAANLR